MHLLRRPRRHSGGDPRRGASSADAPPRARVLRGAVRATGAALLGVLAAALVSCGSSGAGLIPADNASPLVSDFQAIEHAAKTGNGDCSPTQTAIRTTEADFQRLPVTVDAGLRARLREGLSKLRALALEMCAQPSPQTTTGETTSSTESAPAKGTPPASTTPAETQTTSTGSSTTAPPTGTTPSGTTPSGAEGGTAPGVGAGEGQAGEGGASGEDGSGDSGSGHGAGGSAEGAKDGGVSGGTGSGEGER